MFIKTIVKTDPKTSHRYEYLRLCSSYRLATKTRHKSVISLGLLPQLDSREKKKEFADRIEQLLTGNSAIFPLLLDKETEALAQKFYKKIKEKKNIIPETGPVSIALEKDYDTIDLNTIEHEDVREVGSEWLCYQALEQLGLSDFLLSLGWEKNQVNMALVHLISKAVYPASEHKTLQWIQDNSSVAELFSMEGLKISRHQLYQASRNLYSAKDKIEPFLSTKTNELFDITDKIILYDLTNTYFEGVKKDSELSKHGRSKEKRSDAKLIALALVTNAEGFVKYSKIYPGNIADSKTLETTVNELSLATSQQGRKPMVVIDAGIATEDNLKMLKEKGHDYLCVTRSKLKEYKAVNQGQAPIKLEDKRGSTIEVQRVEKQDNKDAFLYIRSEKKALKEASMQSYFSASFEEELTVLSNNLSKKGATKKLDKVWERIGRIKERYAAANKFYTIIVENQEGKATQVRWEKKEVKPEATQGVYFLRCSQTDLDEKTLWDIYNTLTEIEATFRTLKTDLSLRPVYHQTDINTAAHIYMGILAYSIVATVRYQLKQHKINDSWSSIVRKMNTQKNITTSMINKEGKKIIIKACSNPIANVNEIYQALKYKTKPFKRKKYVLPEN